MDEKTPEHLSIDATADAPNWGEAPLATDAPVVAPMLDGLAKRRRRQAIWAIVVATICSSSVFFFYVSRSTPPEERLPTISGEGLNIDSPNAEKPNNVIAEAEVIPSTRVTLLERAKVSWDSNDFASVVDLCTSLLDTEPDNERALFVRCSALAKLGDWSKATEDHLELKRIGSALWRRPSPDIATALVECAKTAMADGYKAMDNDDLLEAEIRFGLCSQLLESAKVVSASSSDSESLISGAVLWRDRCALAKSDQSGQLALGLKVRVWKDGSGKHSFEARLVDVGTKIRLEGITGRQVSVDLSKLSDDDQEFIESHSRLVAELSTQPPSASQ